MSHDTRPLSPSTASAGRQSPAASLKPPRRQIEDESKKQDKPYRRYAAGIERALALFDAARLEWPDYISFLGRLLKAIQAPPTFISLPHRTAIASRLAQCLNPNLPSGVHQKALEVYDHIFGLIGRDGLSEDLRVYLPGLSPVLSFASLAVRPAFLGIIGHHVLTLEAAALRPAVKALILCLLPGIEEVSNEDFDKTLSLLDKLREKTSDETGELGDQYFWQCLFLAAISSPQKRQGALTLLTQRLPMLTPELTTEGSYNGLSYQADPVVTPEPGLLLRCFSCGLEDDQILLQRGFLDLLLTNLPLNSPVLTDMAEDRDRTRLVTAAISVVLRRDMSLNRRLWSWFLGPDSAEDVVDEGQSKSPLTPLASNAGTESQSLRYFKSHGLSALVSSIFSLLDTPSELATAKAKPYRVCLSLMDRTEIGHTLVPHVFLPAMNKLSRYQTSSSKDEFNEVLRSANSFFDGVESRIIWGLLTGTIAAAFQETAQSGNHEGSLKLVLFIVSHFNLREEEMLTLHIPLASVLLLSTLSDTDNSLNRHPEVVELAVQILDKLSSLLPEHSKAEESNNGESDVTELASAAVRNPNKFVRSILSFYQDHGGDISLSPSPVPHGHLNKMLVVLSAQILSRSLESSNVPSTMLTQCSILATLCSKTPDIEVLGKTTLLQVIQSFTASSSKTRINFSTLQALTLVMAQILASDPPFARSRATEISLIASTLVDHLYEYLSPRLPSYNVEASRCLWQIDALFSEDQLLESCLTRSIASEASATTNHVDRVEHARRFAILWTHTMQNLGQSSKRNSVWSSRASIAVQSLFTYDHGARQVCLHRPLLLLLDGLQEGAPELKHFLTNWIRSLSNLNDILELLTIRLCSSMGPFVDPAVKDSEESKLQISYTNRYRQCSYYAQQLSNLLQVDSDYLWAALHEEPQMAVGVDVEVNAGNTIQDIIARACLQIIQHHPDASQQIDVTDATPLQLRAAALLDQLVASPDPSTLLSLAPEETLLGAIQNNLKSGRADSHVQIALINTLVPVLKLKYSAVSATPQRDGHSRQPSREVANGSLHRSTQPLPLNLAKPSANTRTHVPNQLMPCLQDGIGTVSSYAVLSRWITFLHEVVPLFAETIFQSLIPFVETFCANIETRFEELREALESGSQIESLTPEASLDILLTGLEDLLTLAHQRLTHEELSSSTVAKTPDQPQSFFGNMVSGVLTSEATKGGRSVTANSRLAVVLCFQDAVRTCYSMWTWSSQIQDSKKLNINSLASVAFSSSRLRNKTRRLLDRLFAVEILESVEPLIYTWASQNHTTRSASPVVNLVNVLDASKPRLLMPALFNAIYSRTNPTALDPTRISSLTVDLTGKELGLFLVAYSRSLDADAMEEIWTDCMIFLKDVLSNPPVQAQILPSLLEFMVILAEKVDNTNFGEQRRLRKELSETFARLLTATFATRALSTPSDAARQDQQAPYTGSKSKVSERNASGQNLVMVLKNVLPRLATILPDNDRLMSASSAISSNVMSPVIHAKTFPEDLSASFFSLFLSIQKVTSNPKPWRKEIMELFNHSKLFSCPVPVAAQMLPVIRQWTLNDKDRLVEVLGRVSAPTSAGIMFGVGASAARQEADRKAQLNLRRAALLLLANEVDTAVPHLSSIEEKFGELTSTTPASSPSSSTRAELFMLVRAVILHTSTVHLTSLWPSISTELQNAIGSALPSSSKYDTYNTPSLLEACKLLDLLLLLAPEGFQLHEWLFITDTIDAVYRPGTWEPVSLIDDLAEELGTATVLQSPGPTTPMVEPSASEGGTGIKRALLKVPETVANMSKEDLVATILRPWFTQLSMHAFESTYQMGSVNVDNAKQALLKDLFDDTLLMG